MRNLNENYIRIMRVYLNHKLNKGFSKIGEFKMKTVKNIFSSDERFPLYQPSDQRLQTNSWISLDIETGEIDAGYSQQGSTSERAWNDIELHIPMPEQSTTDEIIRVIENHIDDFQIILNDSTISWDRNNYKGFLGDDAQAIYDKLYDNGTGFYCESQTSIIDDLSEWLQTTPEIETTIYSLAKDLLNCDGDEGYYFSDALNSIDAIKSALLDMFAAELYKGEEISQKQNQALIDAGICGDSQI
jgi:hypothetical protein